MPTSDDLFGRQRIRPMDRRLHYVLHQGAYRSATFRRLLRDLQSTELYVYIAAGRCRTGSSPGCLIFQGAKAGHRFVRILVDPAQQTDRIIIILAHELQHALEVSRAPTIVDEHSFRKHFQAIGQPAAGRSATYETTAAMLVERQATRELKSLPAVHARGTAPAAAECDNIRDFCLCDR